MCAQQNDRVLVGVFTGHGPGLDLANLGLLTERIDAIDHHITTDEGGWKADIATLLDALDQHCLLLDSIVFGFHDEKWGPKPQDAIENVGLAAPGPERRKTREAVMARLIELVCARIPPERFVRGQVTFKGHPGVFEPGKGEWDDFVASMRRIEELLHAKNAVMLFESAHESPEHCGDLIARIGGASLNMNWDSANNRLWGDDMDPLDYGRGLASCDIIGGVHVKAGEQGPPGEWGSETKPTADFVRGVVEIGLGADVPCFIAEQEFFLSQADPPPGAPTCQSQEDKAAGLSEVVRFIRAALPT